MTGKDVELVRFCAMLLQGDHAWEANQLVQLAVRMEEELIAPPKGAE